MENTIVFVVGWLALCDWVPTQEQPRQLKGGGQLRGDTAEQFYSEGFVGDLLRACQARDWKTESRLSQNLDTGAPGCEPCSNVLKN